MLIIFREVFNAPISGTGSTTVYTPAELNAPLAQADTFYISARTTQVSGTSVTLTVAIEHSNDGVNWTNKSTPISAASVTANNVNLNYGWDTGTTPGGCFHRLAITLGGTNPSGMVQVMVAGRATVGQGDPIFAMKIWDGPVSGTGTTFAYTDPAIGPTLAQADKMFMHARVTQVSGTSPVLTVAIQSSNGGVNFETGANQKATPINGVGINPNAINNLFGQDTNTVIGGGLYRVEIKLAGTNPSAQIELYVTGREA